jgi:O-antigen/teichoic acid export membrane protein
VTMLARRLGSFAVVVAMPAAAGLVAVSTIAHRAGPEAFLALALGQSVGTIAAIIAGTGWELSGPARVAAQPERGAGLLALSLRMRRRTALATLPLLVLACVLLAPERPLLATLAGLSALLTSLNPSWYLVGLGRPRVIMQVDTLPRSGAALAAAAMIALGAPVWIYPASSLLAVATAYVVFYQRKATMPGPTSAVGLKGSQALRSTIVMLVATIYSSAALPLVQIFAPGAAAGFAASYRLLTYWNLSIIASGNALQQWTAGTPKEPWRRLRQALGVLSIQGLVLGGALAATGPFVAHLLFGHDLVAPPTTFFLLGAAFASICVGTWVQRLVLVPAGREDLLLRANLLAATVGVIGIALLAPTAGATGAAVAILLAELAIVVPLIPAAVSTSRRRPVLARP